MRAQQAASLFLLAFSVSVVIGALGLGLGSLSSPGMGLMFFGSASLLGIFSVARLIKYSMQDAARPAGEPLFAGKLWWRVVCVVGALFAYDAVLSYLGYLISTFLLMSFLLRVAGGRRIVTVLAYSVVITVVTYYVFSKWLNCQFPEGLLGF